MRTLRQQARYFRDPPSPEQLAEVAADIRAMASECEGPMPIEIQAFLAAYRIVTD